MSGTVARLRAVIAADLRIRFRRVSTLVIFLLLSGFAYVWVPDPASGKTLIEFQGRRALLNSAAIGVATATLATLFIGLAGFYVVSNAIRRDVTSRCGFVIASTTVRGTEYLFGKFAGNVVFLATFMGGFMITSMATPAVCGAALRGRHRCSWRSAPPVAPADRRQWPGRRHRPPCVVLRGQSGQRRRPFGLWPRCAWRRPHQRA